jgi:hypothetical protein
MCRIHQRKKCCYCVTSEQAIRLLPVADLAELAVSVVYLILGFTLQDTYLGHVTVLLAFNIFPSLAKLVASLPMLTIGAPNVKTKMIGVW